MLFIVHQEYLQHLRSLDPFPRKIHILFPRKDFYKRHDDRPPLNFVKNGILRFMELNPTWNVTVYDDADMDHIIRMAAGDGIISTDEMNILVRIETQPAAHRKKFTTISSLCNPHDDTNNFFFFFFSLGFWRSCGAFWSSETPYHMVFWWGKCGNLTLTPISWLNM